MKYLASVVGSASGADLGALEDAPGELAEPPVAREALLLAHPLHLGLLEPGRRRPSCNQSLSPMGLGSPSRSHFLEGVVNVAEGNQLRVSGPLPNIPGWRPGTPVSGV